MAKCDCIKCNKKNYVQVYFYALKKGSHFLHKGCLYTKTGAESAKEFGEKHSRVFEVHYGCIISKAMAKSQKISKKDMRPWK